MRENLARKIDELPPELQNEVEDFVEFLREKKMKKAAGSPISAGGGRSQGDGRGIYLRGTPA